MTIDSFLKDLLESDILATIDLTESVNQYISERTSDAKVFSQDYRKLGKEREALEAEFLTLYPDQETGRERILQYNDAYSYMERESNIQYFKDGFYEAVKLLLLLMGNLQHGHFNETKPRESL